MALIIFPDALSDLRKANAEVEARVGSAGRFVQRLLDPTWQSQSPLKVIWRGLFRVTVLKNVNCGPVQTQTHRAEGHISPSIQTGGTQRQAARRAAAISGCSGNSNQRNPQLTLNTSNLSETPARQRPSKINARRRFTEEQHMDSMRIPHGTKGTLVIISTMATPEKRSVMADALTSW